jgi:tetratricopeptide (TPR) repeat protein/tRNA A-37 threonylcarbamoyl transferase component Bud32
MTDSDHEPLTLDREKAALSPSDTPTVAPGFMRTISAPSAPLPSRPMPERIGDYRIVRLLGEGGMGVVYGAEQQSPRREVALKVMRQGHFVDEVHARMFRREAETLGRLKHPNIAAIYESGHTEDGHDFFAMELVRGETLDAWLASRPKEITPGELELRLELFRTICDAVHYAHQRGVIHRDLKPANIIVMDEAETGAGSSSSRSSLPVVRILDFGLARLIADVEADGASILTETGMLKGTLPYMSPEQARGHADAIDVRTDVYALGVILYEMLAMRRPYDVRKSALAEAVRVICEERPRPMAQSWNGTRKLDPDVETIVGKALEKEPDRRYGSVAALSEDIERYLGAQPIVARAPSGAYRAHKFIQRHRVGVTALAAMAVMLVAFSGTMAVLYRRSEANLARALDAEAQSRKNFTLARDSVDRYLNRLVESPDLKSKGLEPLRRNLLATAEEFYRKLSERGGETPELRADLGLAHWRIADVHFAMGESKPAEAAYQKGIAVFEALVKSRPGDDDYRHDLATLESNLGLLYAGVGRWKDAESAYRSGLALDEALRTKDPKSTSARSLAATLSDRMGILFMRTRLFDESEQWCRRGIALREDLAADDPKYENRYPLVESYNNLGTLYAGTGRPADAEVYFGRGVELIDRLLTERPDDPVAINAQASSHGNLAGALVLLGRLDQARVEYSKEVKPRENLCQTHPRVIDYRVFLGSCYTNFGELETRAGRPAEALPWFDKAIRALGEVLEVEPHHAVGRYYLSYTESWHAKALTAVGRTAEALRALDHAIDLDSQGDPELRKERDRIARIASRPVASPNS